MDYLFRILRLRAIGVEAAEHRLASLTVLPSIILHLKFFRAKILKAIAFGGSLPEHRYEQFLQQLASGV
ncbi:hypothetical protein HW132_20025 [Brasilonema sp. CT11]|nr:hypothetical protein [Brasilonema sp. CT11]